MTCPNCRAYAIENEKLKAEMEAKMAWLRDKLAQAEKVLQKVAYPGEVQ